MAVRRKKAAKKKTKKVASKRKRVAKSAARRAARKAAPRKAAARKTKAVKRPARKQAKRGEYGEGNYKASRRFRKSEEAFVRSNRANIAAMGREAEAALDGPEGTELTEAESKARAHGLG
ncbi:MAG TPA: hypothetical protein VMU08_15960 [Rhizomicrobium sp.]|nr:hypothetical protein [Rhizomicrobium sp.]